MLQNSPKVPIMMKLLSLEEDKLMDYKTNMKSLLTYLELNTWDLTKN